MIDLPYPEAIAAQKKPPVLAYVREVECIGCTKCIQSCPVDAIIGAAKQLHTVLTDECTGCGLCIPPCPVDCIDLIPTPAARYQVEKTNRRFAARKIRLQQHAINKAKPKVVITAAAAKQAYIQAAAARVKAKRTHETRTIAQNNL